MSNVSNPAGPSGLEIGRHVGGVPDRHVGLDPRLRNIGLQRVCCNACVPLWLKRDLSECALASQFLGVKQTRYARSEDFRVWPSVEVALGATIWSRPGHSGHSRIESSRDDGAE
jgi:hypothetical protein